MRTLQIFLCAWVTASAAFAAESAPSSGPRPDSQAESRGGPGRVAAPPIAPAAAPRIGYVDVDRVFKEYRATQSKESELEKLSHAKKEEREKMVTEIRNLRDEFALMNEENRAKQRQTIEEKLRNLTAFDAQAKSALLEQRESAVGALLERIERVVNSFAKERGYELVINSRAVLYGVESIDLTDEVISLLNQEYAKAGGR